MSVKTKVQWWSKDTCPNKEKSRDAIISSIQVNSHNIDKVFELPGIDFAMTNKFAKLLNGYTTKDKCSNIYGCENDEIVYSKMALSNPGVNLQLCNASEALLNCKNEGATFDVIYLDFCGNFSTEPMQCIENIFRHNIINHAGLFYICLTKSHQKPNQLTHALQAAKHLGSNKNVEGIEEAIPYYIQKLASMYYYGVDKIFSKSYIDKAPHVMYILGFKIWYFGTLKSTTKYVLRTIKKWEEDLWNKENEMA